MAVNSLFFQCFFSKQAPKSTFWFETIFILQQTYTEFFQSLEKTLSPILICTFCLLWRHCNGFTGKFRQKVWRGYVQLSMYILTALYGTAYSIPCQHCKMYNKDGNICLSFLLNFSSSLFHTRQVFWSSHYMLFMRSSCCDANIII